MKVINGERYDDILKDIYVGEIHSQEPLSIYIAGFLFKISNENPLIIKKERENNRNFDSTCKATSCQDRDCIILANAVWSLSIEPDRSVVIKFKNLEGVYGNISIEIGANEH